MRTTHLATFILRCVSRLSSSASGAIQNPGQIRSCSSLLDSPQIPWTYFLHHEQQCDPSFCTNAKRLRYMVPCTLPLRQSVHIRNLKAGITGRLSRGGRGKWRCCGNTGDGTPALFNAAFHRETYREMQKITKILYFGIGKSIELDLNSCICVELHHRISNSSISQVTP